MRLAARAFTGFLHTPIEETRGAFLYLLITYLAPWINTLPSWCYTLKAKANFFGSFTRSIPLYVVDRLVQVGNWFKKKGRWRSKVQL